MSEAGPTSDRKGLLHQASIIYYIIVLSYKYQVTARWNNYSPVIRSECPHVQDLHQIHTVCITGRTWSNLHLTGTFKACLKRFSARSESMIYAAELNKARTPIRPKNCAVAGGNWPRNYFSMLNGHNTIYTGTNRYFIIASTQSKSSALDLQDTISVADCYNPALTACLLQCLGPESGGVCFTKAERAKARKRKRVQTVMSWWIQPLRRTSCPVVTAVNPLLK